MPAAGRRRVPPRPGLTQALVLRAAADLADREGLEAVTLAAVAQRLNVQPPSLYNHVDGRDGLRRGLAAVGAEELAQRLLRAAAGRSGAAAATAIMDAYRGFAAEHPGLYAATLRAPREGDERALAAAQLILEVAAATLGPYGLQADELVHAIRGLRSLVHGFVALELAGDNLSYALAIGAVLLAASICAFLLNWRTALITSVATAVSVMAASCPKRPDGRSGSPARYNPAMVPPASRYFQKGFGLKAEVEVQLVTDYHSDLVRRLKEAGHVLRGGDLTVRLASEFGFCYGVDRAIDYAYETRRKFPDRRIFLVGEIIHNPGVNARLQEMGIGFLTGDLGVEGGFDALVADDVVILPAFGVTIELLQSLDRRGCVLVDTTCGSVLNVWKNVRRYAEEGSTSVIHGKYWHEETRATASQALHTGSSRYLIVLDRDEAALVCDYIRQGGDRTRFLRRFAPAVSPGFDPDVHLQRIGCANQTTMLSSESVGIGEMFREAIRDRFGEAELPMRFRAFDTICSATQDRQDAVIQLLAEQPIDLMVVIGGYNSSNTCNLARICAARLPTYHIADPDCLISPVRIRHRPLGEHDERVSEAWLPGGSVRVGLTAGASTPDNLVARVIETLDRFCNEPAAS